MGAEEFLNIEEEHKQEFSELLPCMRKWKRLQAN